MIPKFSVPSLSADSCSPGVVSDGPTGIQVSPGPKLTCPAEPQD